MGKIVLVALFLANAGAALCRPWIGVVVGYFFAIFGPQFIWFWAFEEFRPFLYVVLPSLIGFSLAVIMGKVDLRVLREPINICMFTLWTSVVVSYNFGPYINLSNEYRWLNAAGIFSTINNILLFYFVAVVNINDKEKLKWAFVPILLATCYYIYWANEMYLMGNWSGRLGGPLGLHGTSLYRDENTFALLFVTGLPFVYYWGLYAQNWFFRLLLWLIIPFGWHAIFLCGSRGGLVGLGAVVLVTALRSPRKILGALMLPLLVGAFVWQAGPTMKSRVGTFGDIQEDRSAAGRLEAWEAGIRMAIAHPVTGVGVSSFGVAFPEFSDKTPRMAHNTLVQIAAEWGFVGVGAFILAVWFALRNLLRTSRLAAISMEQGGDKFLYFSSEATLAGLCGFLVCSLFLSLEVYEIFYYLLMLSGAIERIARNAFLELPSGHSDGKVAGEGRLACLCLQPRTGKGAVCRTTGDGSGTTSQIHSGSVAWRTSAETA